MMWQKIETAPQVDDEVVLLVLDDGTVTAGYFDNGRSREGVQVFQPGWWWFDNLDTGIAAPIAWQPYPAFTGEIG